MNRTAGGRDNSALDVDSLKAAELARIGEDNTAKKKAVVVPRKQNVVEMTTRVGGNEPAAETEQAINPNKRSDSMMLQRLLYFMGGVAVISLLIATTALVLVLIVMSQSPHTTLTDPGTVHGKISMELDFLCLSSVAQKYPTLMCCLARPFFCWTVNIGPKESP